MFSSLNPKLLSFSINDYVQSKDIIRNRIPYMDLTCLISGKMLYRYNDKEVILSSGDAILFPPGSVRERIGIDERARYASFNIKLDDGFVPEFDGHLPNCITSDTVYMLTLFNKEWQNTTVYKNEMCISLFSYIYHSLIESQIEQANPYIKQIKEYIHEHLSEKITLEEVANLVHLAPQYCSALFHKETGKTISDYIISSRIDAAKQQMILREMNFYELAESVGFNNYNYFSRVFKKKTGMFPMQYKKDFLGIKSGK